MNSKFILVGVTIALTTASFARAESRSGFYLSGGVGVHSLTLTASFLGVDAEESKGGIQTSIKIGGHLTRQWALYYQREASWYRDELVNDDLFVAGMSGIGATYFFKPEVKSGYVEFGVGLGDWTNQTLSSGADVGTAIVLGIGYEFTANLQAGAVITSSNTDFAALPGVEFNTTSIAVKLEAKL